NVTPAAEFNVHADPEAAAVLFTSGAPLTMIGLELTHQVRLGPAHADRLRDEATRTALLGADLVSGYCRWHEDRTGDPFGAMHGAGREPSRAVRPPAPARGGGAVRDADPRQDRRRRATGRRRRAGQRIRRLRGRSWDRRRARPGGHRSPPGRDGSREHGAMS